MNGNVVGRLLFFRGGAGIALPWCGRNAVGSPRAAFRRSPNRRKTSSHKPQVSVRLTAVLRLHAAPRAARHRLCRCTAFIRTGGRNRSQRADRVDGPASIIPSRRHCSASAAAALTPVAHHRMPAPHPPISRWDTSVAISGIRPAYHPSRFILCGITGGAFHQLDG
jgi:hypothetical protein